MKDLFSENAGGYKRYRPEYPVTLVEYLTGLCKEQINAWDCGTGNGQMACLLAEYFDKVYATDSSMEQLKQARSHPSVTYSCQEAGFSNFGNKLFDLVTACQAVHWFDIPKFYDEINRTCKKGAIIALIGYDLPVIDACVDDITLFLYRDILENYWEPERRLVESHYKNLDFPFLELSFSNLFIKKSWNIETYLGYLQTWSALRSYRNKNGRDPMIEITKKLESCWDRSTDKQISFPIFGRIGRVD